MSKDQVIGAAIAAVCVVVALLYLVLLFFYPNIQSLINIGAAVDVKFWVIAVPVAVAFIGILGIGSWIGYTMATTPPPKPIEEITTEKSNENTPNHAINKISKPTQTYLSIFWRTPTAKFIKILKISDFKKNLYIKKFVTRIRLE